MLPILALMLACGGSPELQQPAPPPDPWPMSQAVLTHTALEEAASAEEVAPQEGAEGVEEADPGEEAQPAEEAPPVEETPEVSP